MLRDIIRPLAHTAKNQALCGMGYYFNADRIFARPYQHDR